MVMSASTTFCARLLETHASAYAGAAASLFLEESPGLRERYGVSALETWRGHLTQRLFELSAALEAQQVEIFRSRIRWERKALLARDLTGDDLAQGLVCLQGVLRDQLPPLAWEAARPYLEAAIEDFSAPLEADSTLVLDPELPLDRLTLRYLKSALEGDARGAIEHVVRAVDEGLSLTEAYGDVLIAAQREVGALWHIGELNVAEEHLVTSTTERALAVLTDRAPRQEPVGKTVVAASVAGNRHALGVRILCDLFAIAGWRAICLGADVPAADLAASSVYFNADLVLLSASLPVQLKDVMRSIDALRDLPDQSLKILVGGPAFDDVPDLWRRLGADGHAIDLESIVALGCRQVGLAVT